MDDHTLETADLNSYSVERLLRELQGIQMAMEMLFTKNNSLEDLDITEGGGSPEDQAEYQRLSKLAHLIVTEINKRHMLNEVTD
jgi:hypothetical protein